MRRVTSVMVAICGALIAAASAVVAEATPESTVEPTVTGPPEAASPPGAPFGLKWLASKQAVVELGISLKKPMATDFGDSYVVSQLPKELADLHYAVLSFGYDDQLIRITAIGGAFEGDSDGSRLRSRYHELEHFLEKKYGAGKSEVHLDKQFDGDRFALGLRTKQNWLFTVFRPADLSIELSAFWDTTQPGWRIIFEYLPGLERLKQQRKKSEEEAF